MAGLLYFYSRFFKPLQRPGKVRLRYPHDGVCLAYSELFVLSVGKDAVRHQFVLGVDHGQGSCRRSNQPAQPTQCR